MLNEEVYKTKVVETGESLPFALKLIIGTRNKGEYIVLNKLCVSPYAISECIYSFQELKALRLQLCTKESTSLTFTWNKVYEGQKAQKDRAYELHKEGEEVLLYEHGKTDFLYPWRCGLYHFEVRIDEHVYYGAFRITPKNFFDEQLETIQNYVKSIVNEMILDRGYYKKTFHELTDIEDHSYMQFLRALPTKMKKMKPLYYEIEKKMKRARVYEWQTRERKSTYRSVVMREKKQTNKHYNRRFVELTNCKENGYIKYRTKQFYDMLRKIESFLRETIEKIDTSHKTRQEESKAVQTIMQTIERNGSVTDRDKQKYRNISLLKDTDVRKMSMKLQEYKVLYSILEHALQYFVQLLSHPFWREIEENLLTSTYSLSPSYLQLLQYLDTSKKRNTKDPTFLFVYKPTFLIYEYYAYFIIVSLLQQLGFYDYIPLHTQIQSHFYVDGLQDGTTVVLGREGEELHVSFNDLIETHPLIALSKGSRFYNGEDTKKPDIRIDWYKVENERKEYQSSIIIEVKYSPMYNIFQPVGNTKATEQMYKYWSIKYVEEYEGKKVFKRRSIYEVICVYPGSHMHRKKIESGCGVFIQLYPHKTKNGEEKLIGKNELLHIFKEWLQCD